MLIERELIGQFLGKSICVHRYNILKPEAICQGSSYLKSLANLPLVDAIKDVAIVDKKTWTNSTSHRQLH